MNVFNLILALILLGLNVYMLGVIVSSLASYIVSAIVVASPRNPEGTNMTTVKVSSHPYYIMAVTVPLMVLFAVLAAVA